MKNSSLKLSSTSPSGWLGVKVFQSELPSLAVLLRVGLLSLGIVTIASSLTVNWFDVPVAHDGVAINFDQIVRQAPECQSMFQLLIGLSLLSFITMGLLCRRMTTASTFIACSMIMLGLVFPHFVMLRSPEIAGDATWLQMQHDNLTWLGGDINTAAESGQMAWKSKVYWVDPPRQLSIAPLPNRSAWQIGLDKLDDILAWLGYSNTFCQFARLGWYRVLIGSVLLLMVTLTGPRQLDLRRTGFAILVLCVFSLLGILFALQSPFGVESLLQQASQSTIDGDFQTAKHYLETCGKKFPALTQDTHYNRQLGLIEDRLSLRSDHARMFRATEDEAAGRYDQAFQTWQILCASEDSAIRREALRAVQRFAIQDYNSGRMILAHQRLKFVLQHQPANVKVIYFLQILGVRQKDSRSVYELCDWMYTVTEHFNFSTTKVLKAVSQQHAMVAAAQDGDEAETWRRMIGAKKP